MIIKLWPIETEKPIIKEVPYKPGASLAHYLKGIDLKGKKVIVNGKVIKCPPCHFPRRRDDIIVANEKDWPVLVFVAHAIWIAMLAHPFIAAMWALSLAYSIYSFLTMPRAQGFNTGAGIDQNSPTYAWDGGRTIQEVGTVVPIIYGEHKAWGNIINQYQSTDGDKNYIHILCLLCEGEICGVNEVKVNDIAIGEYQEATYETRLGTNDQDPIDGFSELHNLNDINVKLQYNKPIVYETKRDDVEAFEVYFSFPLGLFQQGD